MAPSMAVLTATGSTTGMRSSGLRKDHLRERSVDNTLPARYVLVTERRLAVLNTNDITNTPTTSGSARTNETVRMSEDARMPANGKDTAIRAAKREVRSDN